MLLAAHNPLDDPLAKAAQVATQRAWAAAALNAALFFAAGPSIFMATLWAATADPVASMTLLLLAGMRLLLVAVLLANLLGLVMAGVAWTQAARVKISRAPAVTALVLGLLSLGFWVLAGIAILSSAAAVN